MSSHLTSAPYPSDIVCFELSHIYKRYFRSMLKEKSMLRDVWIILKLF